MFGKLRNKLFVACLVLGIVDVTTPYLFLADVGEFWGSYLFWSILSLAVIIGGARHVSNWGEGE
ncbi:hypothetical protein AKJ65_03130 [candidate division MSBL1 archaeon SCGC-AAA259E19]|uniref:DUF5668 domain-containing protein n=1 Tax=candidate division MSBL1 archaeon SCGC-AAA259E19 TaxID=1698264 RepID=A0A133UL24_9EURY|nr:hypothetical protein AKJ65_03130 [candidate division MSBL1 archaeon SCGC-AAA259E19]